MLFRNDKKDNRDNSLTQIVPLLPLRELIVFPHEVDPIFVGRQKSIKALEEAEAQKPSAEFMMRRKLREYLGWRRTFAQVSASLFEENMNSLKDIKNNASASAQLRSKSNAPMNKRRRIRGGGMPVACSTAS